MTLHIDLATAQKLIADAVKERGENYVYSNPHSDRENSEYNYSEYSSVAHGGGPTCLYVHKDINGNITPGCGVGLALFNAGIPKEWFDSPDNNSETAEEKLRQLAEAGLLTFDEDASYYLRAFQSAQDARDTWGEAKNSADKTFLSE